MIKIKKGESHRALVLPVLLILAAAFLATSLSLGASGNELTGQQVFTMPRTASSGFQKDCELRWTDTIAENYNEAICTQNKPMVVGGSCDAGVGNQIISSYPKYVSKNLPSNSGVDSWVCKSDASGNWNLQAWAYCCKEVP
jgi:hypothetical protein